MKEKKNKKIKKIGLYLFYGALTVCILVTILSFNDMGEIFRVLGGAVRAVVSAYDLYSGKIAKIENRIRHYLHHCDDRAFF